MMIRVRIVLAFAPDTERREPDSASKPVAIRYFKPDTFAFKNKRLRIAY